MSTRQSSSDPSGGTRQLRVSYRQRTGEHQEIEVEVADTGEPEAKQLAEATKFVQTLEDNSQVAEGPGELPAGATHQIETSPDGKKRLTRKRFSFL